MYRYAIGALMVRCGSNGMTEDNFPELYALEQCTVYKRCYRALYDGEYDNMSRCQDSVADALRSDYDKLYDGCSFFYRASSVLFRIKKHRDV